MLTNIIKVGKFSHMKALYDCGDLHFSSIDEFKQNDVNKERFDTYEGASEIDQIKWIKIQDEKGNTYEFSTEKGKGIHLTNANVITHTNTITGNIFCCSGVTKENFYEFEKINPKFKKFGDTVLLIESPYKFLNLVEDELKKTNMNYDIRLVNYYNSSSQIGSLSNYDKREEYSYLNEVRIWVDFKKNESFILRVGSIKNFTRIFKLEDLLKL